MTICRLCNRRFAIITNSHLASAHKITLKNYAKRFGSKGCGFSLTIDQLAKSDRRYTKWRKSLYKRPRTWCTGFTKKTHPSVKKISDTFKRKKINNFKEWRIYMRRAGDWRLANYKFSPSKKLAFLIGLALGDGNITEFPRTEKFTIALNAKYPALIKYTTLIMKRFFRKEPTIHRTGNCIRVWVYQKNISKRLGIPCGDRGKLKIEIPKWIKGNKHFYISFLKGLFEAEGSLSIHLPTCTYNFQFSNRNSSLLSIVGDGLKYFGFYPEYRTVATRLRRKAEVTEFKKLISFRSYN